MASVDPAREPRPGPVAATPALEGDLCVFPTTDLFQFFALLRLSGTLELARDAAHGTERVRLRLRDGSLVEAETSGPHAFLGELLVRRYGVPLEAVLDGLQRQTAARRHGRTAARLGQLLLADQLLAPEILRRALGDSLCRVAGPVLLWEAGSFAFWTDPSALVPQAFSGHGAHPPREAGAVRGDPDDCAPQISLEELVLRRWSAVESDAPPGPPGE